MHRVTWNLRYPSSRPVSLKAGERPIWGSDPVGPLAMPGTYTVTMSSVIDGVTTDLGRPQEFEVVDLGINTFAADDPAEVHAFQQKSVGPRSRVPRRPQMGDEAESRLAHTRKALFDTPGADTAMLAESQKLQTEIDDILVELRGDETRSRPQRLHSTLDLGAGESHRPLAVGHHFGADPDQEGRLRMGGRCVRERARPVEALASDLETFESQLEAAGAPWTPGRLPNWTK